MAENNILKVGLAQISPVWLNKDLTREKIRVYIQKAGSMDCDLVVFGEGLLPGYPFWLGLTHGALILTRRCRKKFMRIMFEIQFRLRPVILICFVKQQRQNQVAAYVGIIERAKNRGGHSLYCSLVYINKQGEIKSVHRKLQPTYEERLTWSPGDGHGLQVHPLKEFTVGGLNCWENWMPLGRASLYGMGEDLHVAVWPGSIRNTEDITRFIAKEARSFVVSVGGLMSVKDFPADDPLQG